MAVTQQTEVDTTQRALDRIAVARPYFALQDVQEIGPGLVTAEVPLEPPQHGEQGAVSAAQAARHMAILGSCAAALARDDDARHHYLAVEAGYMRSAGAPSSLTGDTLCATASASWIDRRTARAMVTLSSIDGRALTMLDVTFAVMTPRMFARFNQPVAHDLTDDAQSLRRWNPFEVGSLVPTPDGVRLECGPIPAAACAGHFPDFPAAPVAVIMGELCRTAAEALARRLGTETRFSIDAGHVSASGLAAAGQDLVLEASYGEAAGDCHLMFGTATADGQTVGEVQVLLSIPDRSEVAGADTC